MQHVTLEQGTLEVRDASGMTGKLFAGVFFIAFAVYYWYTRQRIQVTLILTLLGLLVFVIT